MSVPVRFRAIVLALAVALAAVAVPAFAELASGPDSPPPAGFERDRSLEAVTEALRAEQTDEDPGDEPDRPQPDPAELGPAEARELVEDEFAGELREPERPLDLPEGQRVEQYLGEHAALVSGGAADAQVAVSAMPLRVEDEEGDLAPVDLGLERRDGALTPANPLVPTTIPVRLQDGVKVGDDGVEVHLGAGAAAPQLVENKAFYPEVERDADWVVGPVPTGIEALLQVRSAAAAERHALRLDLPEGAVLRPADDGGVDVVRDEDVIARVVAPSALDADGTVVPVRYEVEGDTITLVVEHRDRGFAYPLLVDPVVEDWGTPAAGGGWFSNPQLDQLGWTFSSSPTGLLKSSTQGTSIASYGKKPGRGLYVFAPPKDAGFNVGDYGYWFFEAPGETTYIRRAEFRTMYFDGRGAAPNKPVVVTGLWSSRRGFFSGLDAHHGPLTATNATVEPGDNIPGPLGQAHGTDNAVFGLLMPTRNRSPKWTTAYLGGAVLYLDDPEPPTITRADTGAGGVTVAATDPGLGVRTIRILDAVTGREVAKRTNPCAGTRLGRCPQTWTQTIDLTGAVDGRARLKAVVADVAGHESAPQEITVDIDDTPPTLTATGTLADADGRVLAGGGLTLAAEATDAASGVRALELRIDGRRAERVEQASHTFSVDAGALAEGRHEVVLAAIDGAGNESTRTFRFTVDRAKPTLAVGGALKAAAATWHGESRGALTVAARDAGTGVASVEVLVDGLRREYVHQPCAAGGCALERAFDLDLSRLAEGEHLVQVLALDGTGELAQEAFTVRLDRADPKVELGGALAEATGDLQPGRHGLTIAATDAPGSGVRRLEVLLDGERKDLAEQACDAGGCSLERTWTLDTQGLESGPHVVTVVARDGAGRTTTREVERVLADQGPAEPPVQAPRIDAAAPNTVADSTRFLYAGPDPVQTGVRPGAILDRNASALRGKVTDRAGEPLAGVRVTVVDHPEFGEMLTRTDGEVLLAISGGIGVTLQYEKDGYLPVQRRVTPLRQEWTPIDDVVLTQVDDRSTQVPFGGGLGDTVVHEASTVTDEDGRRQATLLFQEGTEAQMVLEDGTTRPLTDGRVRATEYTVGDAGEDAMPGDLPTTSAYTYAAEFGFDEARAAGAREVTFSKPVVSYTDNFLHFPVGENVPAGYYDTERARWIAADNGRVIEVVSESGGLAAVDVDHDAGADAAEQLLALGIDEAERRELARLYEPGKQLWRVQLEHFSAWDYNWGWGPPEPNEYPPVPDDDDDDDEDHEDDSCQASGSIIDCENQTLGERLPVRGTPFTLNYRSDRTPGWVNGRTTEFPLTTGNPPSTLEGVNLEITVGGQTIKKRFSPAPRQRYRFTWDGEDGFGRALRGKQTARITVAYGYTGTYRRVARFGAAPRSGTAGIAVGDAARQEILFRTSWEVKLGNDRPLPNGLGGWTLGVHHTYDPTGKTLWLGTGERRSVTGATGIDSVITTAVGKADNWNWENDTKAPDVSLDDPQDTAFLPNGDMIYADRGMIRRVDANGAVTTIAGARDWYAVPEGKDGDLALGVSIGWPQQLATGPDGSIYLGLGNVVRRIDPSGRLSTVAGKLPEPPPPCDLEENPWGCGGVSNNAFASRSTALAEPAASFADAADDDDGDDAIGFELGRVQDVDVGADGSLYLVAELGEWGASYLQVFRVTDGKITLVAGNGTSGSEGDGGPATEAPISARNIAVGRDGSVYLAAYDRVRRVRPDGTIVTHIKAPADASYRWSWAYGIAIAGDDTLYIEGDSKIYKIRPSATGARHVAGDGGEMYSYYDGKGDGGPGRKGRWWGGRRLSVGPDGALYITDNSDHRIRRIEAGLPAFDGEEVTLASADGEQLFLFDERGRHLRTVDAATNQTVWSFGYDGQGRLGSVTDGDGNVTRLERDADGTTTIVAPYGQRTVLRHGADGFLSSVTDEAGDAWKFTYHEGGLLASFTDPGDRQSTMQYDPYGRLVEDRDAAGSVKTLTRREVEHGFEVEMTSGEGRKRTHRVVNDGKSKTKSVELAGGLRAGSVSAPDAGQVNTSVDGTQTTVELLNDPRWGMQAPFASSERMVLPSGRSLQATAERKAELRAPADPFSAAKLTRTSTTGGRTTTSVIDTNARTETVTSPAGRAATTTFDALRRPVRVSSPGRADIVTERDERGRLKSIEQGDRSSAFTYDERGRLETVTDAIGRTTTYRYDLADRVVAVELPGGSEVGYGYNRSGELTSVTPAGRPKHVLDRDALGMLAAHRPPAVDGATEPLRFGYDRDGVMNRVERADGKVISITPDALGRPERMAYPGGGIDFAYDGNGQLSGATTDEGQSYEVDHDGSLVTALRFGGAVSGAVEIGYDGTLRPNAVTVGGDQVTYGYDNDDLLTRAGELSIVRDPQTGDARSASIGGASTAWEHDASYGELARTTDRHGDATVLDREYVRDSVGRVKTVRETIGDESHEYEYAYDDDGRLAGVERDGEPWARYAWDANGNRTAAKAPGQDVTAQYDDQDRLLSQGGVAYAHNAQGERTSADDAGQLVRYTHNALGQLTGAKLADGREVTYVLDAAGRRVGRKLDGELVQRLVYQDDLRPAAELDADGDVVTRFVYAGGGTTPAYLVRDGKRYRVVTDHLGSVRAVVDTASGEVVQRLEYDPFGRLVSDTNPGFQPFGFGGGLRDPDTRLVHFGAREYDPATGRWLSRDPLLFDGGDANLYGYVLGDPVNAIDPTGLFGWPSLRDVSNFAAGFGDAASFGITNRIRESIGANGVVDKCSGMYIGGGIVGEQIRDRVTGGLSRAVSARSKANAVDDADDFNPNVPFGPPGKDFEWRGHPEKGSWYNPKTGEYWRADPNHGPPQGPHFDYRDPDGKMWRVYPDGRREPK